MHESPKLAADIQPSKSIKEVVANGLCIGCGLCEAATRGRVKMTMTRSGSLRPLPLDQFKQEEELLLLSACPGVVVQARAINGPLEDIV